MSKRLAKRVAKRVAGALLLFSVPFGANAMGTGVAIAVEAEEHAEPLPAFDEIGSGSETAGEFLPEEPEEPPFFRWFYYPLIVIAVLVVLRTLFLYLVWQPYFAEEGRRKRRR